MTITEQYIHFSHMAEQILLQSGICAFPVDPIQIARKNGVTVTGYEKFSAVSGISMQELLAISEDAFGIMRSSGPVIVYNRQIKSKGRKRWTILHELSHVLLEHIDLKHPAVYNRNKDTRRWMEQEADCLTSCLAAPLPVALVCGIKNAEELQRLFGLSAQASQNIYQDYKGTCIGRKILAVHSEKLLQNCVRFFQEWQLKRFYWEEEKNLPGQRGKYLNLEIIPEQDELY